MTRTICRLTGEIFPSVSEISGGLTSNYYNLSRHLYEHGYKTIMISAGAPKYPEYERIDEFLEIHRLHSDVSRVDRILCWYTMNSKAKRILKDIRYDAIQLHNFFYPWLQSVIRKPNILTVHGCDWEQWSKSTHIPLHLNPYRNIREHIEVFETVALSKTMCKKANYVVGVCSAVEHEIRKNVEIDNVTTIPNGADTTLFKRIECKKLSEEYGVDYTLLYVGSFHPRKGLRYLLKALSYLHDTKLIIIGSDRREYTEYLHYLTKKYGVSDKIVSIGKLPNRELVRYYSSADLFVFPTLSEGLPKAVIEAMACECPVVASSVSGIPEIIHDKKTGLLVADRNTESLYDAIKWALAHPHEMRRMANRGRKLIAKEYTWAKSAKKYARLYDCLIQNKQYSAP